VRRTADVYRSLVAEHFTDNAEGVVIKVEQLGRQQHAVIRRCQRDDDVVPTSMALRIAAMLASRSITRAHF
jgi:hypothetical protein